MGSKFIWRTCAIIGLTNSRDFVTTEQQIVEDDADFKTLQKSANVGLELLTKIQYDNPICRDNPSVFQEAYDYWVALRQSVATYLLNRCGDQRENEVSTSQLLISQRVTPTSMYCYSG